MDEIDYPDYEMQKELNKNSKKFWDKKIDKYLIYWAHLYGIGNNNNYLTSFYNSKKMMVKYLKK